MNTANTQALVRMLITYGLCIPLAIWLGFTLANPFGRDTFNWFGVIGLLLATPILLRWHHFLLVLCWNLNMVIFFLPGGPALWLPMVMLSLGFSVLQRALNNQAHFIRVPQITWPLIFLLVVVVVTAKLTGGFGMRSLGGDAVGGKRYIWMIVAILGYFALTAKRIPPRRAGLYVGLFFCGNLAGIVGDFYGKLPNIVFAFFPPSGIAYNAAETGVGLGRLANTGIASYYLILFLLACYGMRGIFLGGRPWRILALFSLMFINLMGGFRAQLLGLLMVFALFFYLERLHRTRLLPIFALGGLSLVVLMLAFTTKLPVPVQRTLSVLPFVHVSSKAALDAQDSYEWRVRMWQSVLPQVPQHLLLGKGFSISTRDLDTADLGAQFDAVNTGSAIASDFHNGPLSVVLPFGLWGCIGIIWLWIASLQVLLANYRHGDPALFSYNRLLLVFYIVLVVTFLFVFGSLYSQMVWFTGIIGLSVSLNGGVRRPAPVPVPVAVPRRRPSALIQPRLQPF